MSVVKARLDLVEGQHLVPEADEHLLINDIQDLHYFFLEPNLVEELVGSSCSVVFFRVFLDLLFIFQFLTKQEAHFFLDSWHREDLLKLLVVYQAESPSPCGLH